MKPTRWLCLSIVAAVMLASVAAAAPADDNQKQRELTVKMMNDGNFNEAYEGFKKLALDPKDNPHMVGDDLQHATSCLQRLNRLAEVDAFREAVIEVHKDNWQLLRVAAENYMNLPHHGFIVAGEFNRGNKRGGQGGQMVNAHQRDRIRALQLMTQALPLAKQDDTHAIVGDYLLSFARILLNNRGWSEAWRLQYKSDLDVLPDYDPGYGYGRQAGGAPVDAEGNPVFHYTPKTFEEAATDGERWRWCLEQAMEFDPAQRHEVRMHFADFLFNQFGVQTMAHYGWRFGRMQTDDTKEDESGTYALHTLKENETIARLATGVKRFELPDEFNFVKICQAVGSDRPAQSAYGRQALQRLVQVFENRRQYATAADYCRQLIAVSAERNNDQAKQNWQKRLEQIVGNWGRFEQIMPQPAGKGASVEFRFRNGKAVQFTAHTVKVKKLLDDVKAYLKSNPSREDRDWYRKVNIANIGYRLVHENQKQYVGEQVDQWDMKLDPRENHFDKRITVATRLQEPGAYLLTSKMADGNTSHIIIWVSDTAIVKKPLDGKMYYYVADAVSGKPIEKANLEFFGYRMERTGNNPRSYKVVVKQFAEHTDRDGQVFTDAATQPNNLQWIITATNEKGRFAYLGFTGAWYGQHHDAEYKQVKAFAITDRPVYRPDQTVHWKFWVRHAQYDQEDVSQFAGQKIGIEIHNPKNERIVQKELVADEYGGIKDDLELPADATLGVYRMTVGVLGGVQAAPVPAPRVGTPGRAPIVRSGPLGIPKENVGKHKMTRLYGSSTFRVEEYKKPEFEVTIDAPTEPVMLGEKITATINAKYYFGSPVTEAKVKYKILRTSVSERWYPPMPWDWFYGPGYWWYAYDSPWYPGWKSWGCRRPFPIWWPQRQGPPEVVAEQEVKIGKDGTVKVEIDTAVAKAVHPDQDHKYSITAEVVDQSRRTIVGTGDVLVARKPFKVYSWVDRGYYRVGDTIQSSHSARTLDGKPVQGEGKITLYRISYKDGKPVETEVASRELATNEEGRAERKLKATRAGQYRLSYRLTDSKDHTIEGGYLFTIIGEGFDGSQFRFNHLELIPDKKEYADGGKVKLQVNTDRAGGTVLLFVRPANSVYLAPQVIRLDGKSTVAEIAVSEKDMPNFFVEAVTVAGGRVHTESKEIVVPPEKRVLNVELKPSSEAYKPGEKAKVQIRLTDFVGENFSGSAVVAIYDKSVEYISGGSNVKEIKEFFWKWRRHHRPRTENNLARFFGNIVPKGVQGMGNLGVFGATVAEELNALGDNGNDAQVEMAGGALNSPGGRLMQQRARSFGAPMAAADDAMPQPAAPMGMAEGMGGGRMLAAKAAGGAPPAAAVVQPTVRKKFADTALWVGALQTKKDGTAEVELDMPENLTTWRIKVWGMGHGTKVGEGVVDVVTRKDLIVRLQAPRFFVQKDEVVLSANVHNYLKGKKKVKAVLEIDEMSGAYVTSLDAKIERRAAELRDSKLPGWELAKSVEVEPNGEARIDWRVRIDEPGEIVVRMKALTDEESDAMEMRFPCQIHGLLKMDSYSGAIRPKDTSGKFTVTVPAQRRPKQTRLEVRYSPTLAGAMVDALPYLVDYPYGCTEQTLNRFLPTVITQKVLIDMGLDLEAIKKKRTNLNAQEIGNDRERAKGWQRWDRNPVFDQAEVTKMVKEGVRKLTEMQLSDGGWGWFSGWGEHSYPHTTAYVVHGLQVAKANDVALVPGTLEKGVAWLKRYQDEQVRLLKNALVKPEPKKPWKDQADNLDAFVYMVLVDADVANAEMRDFLYRDRTKLAVYGMAMYGMALHKQNEQEKLAMILRNIGQYVQQDDENQTAWLNMPGSNWWHWYGSEYEAHAYYLKLLSKTDPKGELAPRLVKYLLNNRKHATYWNSTRDTSLCVEAMADFVRASGEDKPELTVEVLMDGKLQKAVEITPANLFLFDNKFVVEGEKLAPGPHQVELRKKGTGPLYYNGYMTNFTLEDFITKAGLEIKVNRKYYKLNKVEKTIKAAGSRGQVVDQKVEKYERQELPNLSTLKSGDLCEIELEIDSKNDYEYLVFEDMKAAGFEAVDLRSGYNGNTLGAYMEFRDNRVVLFARRLARGKHSVSYRMRAETPGKFSALPTRAWAMYAPELKANSDEIKLNVED